MNGKNRNDPNVLCLSLIQGELVELYDVSAFRPFAHESLIPKLGEGEEYDFRVYDAPDNDLVME
jgi:hypothetical protein